MKSKTISTLAELEHKLGLPFVAFKLTNGPVTGKYKHFRAHRNACMSNSLVVMKWLGGGKYKANCIHSNLPIVVKDSRSYGSASAFKSNPSFEGITDKLSVLDYLGLDAEDNINKTLVPIEQRHSYIATAAYYLWKNLHEHYPTVLGELDYWLIAETGIELRFIFTPKIRMETYG